VLLLLLLARRRRRQLLLRHLPHAAVRALGCLQQQQEKKTDHTQHRGHHDVSCVHMISARCCECFGMPATAAAAAEHRPYTAHHTGQLFAHGIGWQHNVVCALGCMQGSSNSSPPFSFSTQHPPPAIIV
jgi:hypothetical protein